MKYKYKNKYPAFIARVKELMEENNTSMEELSKIAGLSLLECDKMLRGKEPSYKVFINLVLHYNVSCDFLLGLTDDRERKKHRTKKD